MNCTETKKSDKGQFCIQQEVLSSGWFPWLLRQPSNTHTHTHVRY